MNYEEENLNPSTRVDDRALMALVDGELSDDRRREVLQRLDARSGSDDWRRCALMFLEDQALRAALSLPGNDSTENDVGIVNDDLQSNLKSVATSDRAANGNGAGRSLWALAAGLAIAFFVGMQVGSPWNQSSGNSGGRNLAPVVADGSVGDDQPTAGGLFANSPKLRNSGPGSTNSTNQNWPNEANTVFVQDDNFWNRGGLVPGSVRQSFRNLGTEVRSERGWMPGRTEDGRQIVFPYEKVRFVPVEQPSF